MELRDSRTLLTGASGPTGGVIARELAKRGAKLVVSGRNLEALEALKGELDGSVEVIPADLATPEGAGELVKQAGDVDVLVSFAGISPIGPLDGHPADELDRVLDVNLRAPVHLAAALIPGMVERGRGHLLFMSSISGKAPSPKRSLYTAPCYGLRGFAGCLRLDLHEAGIGVTTVMPGPIRTPGDDEMPGFSLDLPPEAVAKAIVRGIEHNKDEVVVAPWIMRAFIRVGSVFPAMARKGGPDANANANTSLVLVATMATELGFPL